MLRTAAAPADTVKRLNQFRFAGRLLSARLFYFFEQEIHRAAGDAVERLDNGCKRDQPLIRRFKPIRSEQGDIFGNPAAPAAAASA